MKWDLATFTFALRATRPIKRDEQIFCSYLQSDFSSTGTRRQELQRKYKFICKCPACESIPANPEFPLSESEARRMFLLSSILNPGAHDAVFTKWLEDDAPAAAPTTAEPRVTARTIETNALARALQFWAVMEQEGYVEEGVWERTLILMCKAYGVLEDREQVAKWALIAAALRIAFTGEDGGWRAIAENPERIEWWSKDRARATIQKAQSGKDA